MRPAGGCWFQHNEFEFSATRMSALCQKRTLARLFDHFVGTANQCRWQINAKRLRGFQIHKELKVRGQLEWQISRAPRRIRATRAAACSPISLGFGPYDIRPPSRTIAPASKIVGNRWALANSTTCLRLSIVKASDTMRIAWGG